MLDQMFLSRFKPAVIPDLLPPPPIMDPPPTFAPSDAVDSHPNSCNSKLRLMCSYGGQIAPRQHSNSLCYSGGETRIVAVDRRTTAAKLSSLKAYLSRVVYSNRPFQLKYQLPNEDLDALISVTTDEDLENMVEEHDRIVGSSTPSRIRLFLFPAKPESIGSVLLDPKAESWFCDALKGTKIMQRGQSADSGLVDGLMGLDCGGPTDSDVESLNRGGGDAKHGCDLSSVPESMLLDTNSSFGSTGSSASMSNLPPIGLHVEDGGINSMDKKLKPPLTSPVASDATTMSAVSPHQATFYQDPTVHVPPVGTRVALESESRMLRTTAQISAPPQVYSYPERTQNQQEVRYIQAGLQYITQYHAGGTPYPMNYPPMPQHQHHNNPYPPGPVYVLPVRQPQPYNTPKQSNFYETTTAAPRPPVHPHVTMMAPQVGYKESLEATKGYQTGFVATGSSPTQQTVDRSDMHVPPVLSAAAADYDNEYEEEMSYTTIYKTQPPAPVVTRL